jgi:DNA-binding MarR family transcriptional regulator
MRKPTDREPADRTSLFPPLVRSATGAPPLPRRPGPLSRRFQQVCAGMITEALAGEELVQLEFGSLVYIDIEPGLDQRRLAEAMGIDPSNASLIVDRLHAMGLIARRINGADRRARELYLTPKGKKL